MLNALRTTLALAVVVSGRIAAASEPEMRLLAKKDPTGSVAVDLATSAIRSGVDQEAIRNQVELAMRRCGFKIIDSFTNQGKPLSALVAASINGLPINGGFAADARLHVTTLETVRGEIVRVEVFGDDMIFVGPPGSAGEQARDTLARLLDKFSNQYLQARDEVGAKTKGPTPKK